MSLISRLLGRRKEPEGPISLGIRGPAPAFERPPSRPAAIPPPTEDAFFSRGDIIKGVYRVDDVLAGGMGIVYICRKLRAEDAAQSPGVLKSASFDFGPPPSSEIDECLRYQAIKSFRRTSLLRSESRQRFNREALLWVSLSPHPNIVRALTFDAGTPLLFLEYVDGGNLRERLGAQMDPKDVARIALEFCSGMVFMYDSASIIHRDIKPANILLTRKGTVKITDFGIAHAFTSPPEPGAGSNTGSAAGPDFATRSGTVIGSLPWMSPEQFTAPDQVTVTSDIYSFGVVLFEMLTGQMPYTAASDNDWARKILTETPVSPAKLCGAAEEASTITMKCLEKNPENRFRDFAELRQAIELWAISMGWSSVIPAHLQVADLEATMTAADWAGRGYAFGQLNRSQESYDCYVRARDIDPTYLGIHTNIGTALMRLSRNQDALEYYRKETELHPTLGLAWDTLGQGYAICNQLPEALEACRKAAELAPDNIGVVRKYSFAARRAGATEEHQRAVAAVKALLDGPGYDDPRSAINEALMFLQDGDRETGLELQSRSVEKYPHDALVWYNMGVTAHRYSRPEAALNCYSQAIERDRRSTLAFFYRGALRAQQGQNDLAQADWQAVLAIDPASDCAKIVRILLQFRFSPQMKDHLDTIAAPATVRYLL